MLNTGVSDRNPEDMTKSFYDDPAQMIGVQNTHPTLDEQLQSQNGAIDQSLPVKKRTSQDILKEIYSYQAPQPTYDPNRPEEIKRIARTNAIGEGLKSIGDFISLGTGANVNRRQPDQLNQQMLGSLWQNVDRVNQGKDQWNYQNYLSKIRNANTELDQLRHDDNLKAVAERDNKEWAYRGEKDKAIADRWKSEDAAKKEQSALEFEQKKELAKLGYGQEAGLMDKRFNYESANLDKKYAYEMNKYNTKTKYDGKNFNLLDNSGQVVKQLVPGELEKITQLILKDPSVSQLANNDIMLMKSQFGEGLTKQAQQTIIAYYWDKSPLVQEYLKGSKPIAPAPSTLSPQGQAEQNQAVEQNAQKIDWSQYKEKTAK